MHHPSVRLRRGFSLVGILISMAIMVVLFALLMTSLNKAVTGQGSAVQGTVRSVQDEWYLSALFQSMVAHSIDNKGQEFLIPSELSGSNDVADNTTANVYSAMVMNNYTSCKQLISGNEYNGRVQEKLDYDMTAYKPADKVYWDKTFVADLNDLSNVSFAHVPLHGERFDRHWKNELSSTFPVLGNRGPKDGIDNPQSYTYGRNGQWGGHLCFGDGHVSYVNTFSPNGIVYNFKGETKPDNIFKIDADFGGPDAVLGFTKKMLKAGPMLQWD